MSENKISLMLVSNTNVVASNWGFYKEGLESVLSQASGDSTLAAVYESLMLGHMQLWLVYNGPEYAGLVTTRYVDLPQGERYVDMVHGYLKPGLHYTALFEGIEEVIENARKYNYNSVRFYTRRDKAFERKLADQGWERGYTEFVKKVVTEE